MARDEAWEEAAGGGGEGEEEARSGVRDEGGSSEDGEGKEGDAVGDADMVGGVRKGKRGVAVL